MAKTPSAILKKTKAPESKKDNEDEEEKPKAGVKRNALIDFISKHKHGNRKA